MEYYERLRQLREDRDLNQTEIGKLIGVRQTYYSNQERGIKPFKVEQIAILCEFYKVSADYILGLPKDLNWPR